MSDIRGSGRTAQQMQAAPLGAVFVWCNANLYYPRNLARYLNRTDLEIVTPQWVFLNARRRFCIVVDHAANLSSVQSCVIRAYSVGHACAGVDSAVL